MKILNWKAFSKNTLQGFFDLQLDSGLLIVGMTYHSQNGRRWVNFPAKPYEDENGQTQWQNIVKIPDEDRNKKFQQLVISALDSHFATHQQDGPDDIPF